MKSSIVILCGFALMLGFSTAHAQHASGPIGSMNDVTEMSPSTTKGPFYDQSENELKGEKFARGVVNVTCCLAEIPKNMMEEGYKTSPVTGAVVGAFKGVALAGERFVVGLWEIATFYAPTKNNYQPYIQPEVVMADQLH